MTKEEEPICIECDKKNQKDLPSNGEDTPPSSASKGMPCEASYTNVTACMEQNAGQISACRDEWDAFKLCHEEKNKK